MPTPPARRSWPCSTLLLGALLSTACEPARLPSADERGIVVRGDTYEARARAAWAASGKVTLTDDARRLLEKVGTAVAIDGEIAGLPEKAGTLSLADPVLAATVFGTDENALADAIRAAGAKALVVRTASRPSFDRDSHVLSRLVHHDALSRFQLAGVEVGALVYLVVDKPLQFPPELAASAIKWVRASLSGENPPPFPAVRSERSTFTLLTTLRSGGNEMASSLAEGETLDKALTEVVHDLEAMHRRQREPLGFARLQDAMPGMTLEMHRVLERAPVVPRDEQTLLDLWELGVDGAILLDRVTAEEKAAGKKSQAGAWPGSVAVHRGLTKPDQFLRHLAREFRWDSVRPWVDSEVSLELVRDIHYIELPGGQVQELVRGVAPVPLSMVSREVVRSSIVYAGEWYLANLQPDGTVTYKFWPEENRYADEYNHVRHELATWNLWQAWTLDPRPEFLEGARRAQDWTLESLVIRDGKSFEPWEAERVAKSPFKEELEREGMAYFSFDGNNKLGSVVVALLGMVDLQRSTGDHSLDELMRLLGRFVLFSQEDGGNVRAYHVPPGHPYEFNRNDIVPGETALALVALSEYFDDPRYLDALPKFFEYYQPWFRERAARKHLDAPWPAKIYENNDRLELVQFGPWTVMAADAYVRNRPEATDIAKFGLEVGRWMVEAYEYTSERTPFPDYVGGYYKFEGELPAMQAFCYGEGTAAAYSLALRADPSQAAYFERATRETVRFGLVTQHDGIDGRSYSRPKEVLGGIKYALNEPKIRIDYVYHMQSALYQWLRANERDPSPPPETLASPDAAVRALLAAQDMPGFRDPAVVARTSVPSARAKDATALVAAARATGVAGPIAAASVARLTKMTALGDDEGAE